MQNLQGWFSAGIGPHNVYGEHRERIAQPIPEIIKKRTVEMRYSTAGRDKTSRREVDPYHNGGLCRWRFICDARRPAG